MGSTQTASTALGRRHPHVAVRSENASRAEPESRWFSRGNQAVRRCAAVLLILLGGACAENPLVNEPNLPPRANAGADQVLPFAGVPVAVVLDGSFSSDMDSQILDYRWLSATYPPTGGTGRYVPPGETTDWPPNVMRPMIMLPQGAWTFALQVIDDKGATSPPDFVMVTVGDVAAAGAGGASGSGVGGAGSGAAGAGAGGAGGGAAGTGAAGAAGGGASGSGT